MLVSKLALPNFGTIENKYTTNMYAYLEKYHSYHVYCKELFDVNQLVDNIFCLLEKHIQ